MVVVVLLVLCCIAVIIKIETELFSKMSQGTEECLNDRPQHRPNCYRPSQQQVRTQDVSRQHIPSHVTPQYQPTMQRPSHQPTQQYMSRQQLHSHFRPQHCQTMQRLILLNTKFSENQVSQSHMRPRHRPAFTLPSQHPSGYHQHPQNHENRITSAEQTTAPVHSSPSSYERQHTVIPTHVTVSNNHQENSETRNDAPPDYNVIVFSQSPPPYEKIV